MPRENLGRGSRRPRRSDAMPHSHIEPAQGTVPASSTFVPGLQLSAVLGLGFIGAILVLDGGHSFDTCRAVGLSGLGGCATLWANLAILAVVISLVLLPVTMTFIRVTRLRRHQAAPRLISQPTRQAWAQAPLPPARPRFVAPLAPVAPAAAAVSAPIEGSSAPSSWTPPGPSYIQPVMPDPVVSGGADLDLLRRDFQALKAQLEGTDPTRFEGEVVPFHRAAPKTMPQRVTPADEPTPA